MNSLEVKIVLSFRRKNLDGKGPFGGGSTQNSLFQIFPVVIWILSRNLLGCCNKIVSLYLNSQELCKSDYIE
jgi:hypothetical protein